MKSYKYQLFLRYKTDAVGRKHQDGFFDAIDMDAAKRHIVDVLFPNFFTDSDNWDHTFNKHFRKIEKPSEFVINRHDDSLFLSEV